jgi:hypothetical protein
MSFASDARELRRVALTMLETHIVMSSLIFCLILILVLCLALLLMNLTITHMVLINGRGALLLDALDTAHILIMVTVSRVGLISLLELFTLTLS